MENFRLRVFRSVAQHLSFTRAAEELFLSQPAVTQQIKALEDELGVPMFDRSGGRIQLTPAGRDLLPYAEKLRELAAEAVRAVAQASGEYGGELTLGASQTIGQYLLPKLVAAFRAENPKVRVTACSGNTDAMLQALDARRIQLALIEGPAMRKDLRVEPFLEDHMVLVVPPGHEWAGQDVSLQALGAEPLLMREFGSGSRRVIEHALHDAGLRVKDFRIEMELDSTEGLLSAVEAGLGITFVSRWAARNHLALGTLKLARVRGLELSRRFSLAYPAGPDLAGNVGAFRAFLLSRTLDFATQTTGTGIPNR